MTNWLQRVEYCRYTAAEFRRDVAMVLNSHCVIASSGERERRRLELVRLVRRALLAGVAVSSILAILAWHGIGGPSWENLVRGMEQTTEAEQPPNPAAQSQAVLDVSDAADAVAQVPVAAPSGEANLEAVAHSVRGHEGYRPQAYWDSRRKRTIGYGHNMDEGRSRAEISGLSGSPNYDELYAGRASLSRAQVEELLLLDLALSQAEVAKSFSFYGALPAAAKEVLLEMHFQMGLPRLLQFRKMLAALSVGDFNVAADEMLDSKWAHRDSPSRAAELSRKMRAVAQH